jgi:hypothetical protein
VPDSEREKEREATIWHNWKREVFTFFYSYREYSLLRDNEICMY